MGTFRKTCSTAPTQSAPNPDPSRWMLINKWEFAHAYVLHVEYCDCTNFEGRKVMVFAGEYHEAMLLMRLDPHFSEDDRSPIACFKPTPDGLRLAAAFAESYKPTPPPVLESLCRFIGGPSDGRLIPVVDTIAAWHIADLPKPNRPAVIVTNKRRHREATITTHTYHRTTIANRFGGAVHIFRYEDLSPQEALNIYNQRYS